MRFLSVQLANGGTKIFIISFVSKLVHKSSYASMLYKLFEGIVSE